MTRLPRAKGREIVRALEFDYSPIFFRNPHFSRLRAFRPPPLPPYADCRLFVLARTELFIACRNSLLVLV